MGLRWSLVHTGVPRGPLACLKGLVGAAVKAAGRRVDSEVPAFTYVDPIQGFRIET